MENFILLLITINLSLISWRLGDIAQAIKEK